MDHLTQDEFLEIFPQFAAAPEEWIDGLLNVCETAAFNECLWGSWLHWGEANFVAHYLMIRQMIWGSWDDNPDGATSTAWMQNAIQSAVTSFNAGSVSYSKDSAMDAGFLSNPYMRTIYGQEYWAKRKSLAVGLVMVT